MQVLEGLERIPEIIRVHGWTKGTMMNMEGEVCIVGAARLAFKLHPPQTPPAYNEAIKLMAECAHKRTQQGLLLFNDSVTTTKKDVLDVVHCAIREARKGSDVRPNGWFVFVH